MDGVFNPTCSSNDIWYDTNLEECLTTHIEGIESDISGLETSKANIDHTHVGYAPIDHTHSGYASVDHTHTGYASVDHTHNYAGSSSVGGAATSAIKLSTARTIRTNLASTSTASFDGTANVSPGVTGTLPIANGGTGATTAAAAKTNLGLGHLGAACSAKGSVSSLSLSALTITQLTLNTWKSRTDTAFAFSGGGIKCPYAGTILVSGTVYITNSTSVASAGCYVYKGSTEIASQYGEQGSGCVSSGMTIIDVAAGDIIYLKARCQIAATTVPNNGSVGLNIMYIK